MKLKLIIEGILVIPILGIINVLLGKLAYSNCKFKLQNFLKQMIYKSPMPISYWMILSFFCIIFAIVLVALKRMQIMKLLISIFMNIVCILMVIYYIGSTY